MEIKEAVKIAVEVYIANPDCDNEVLEAALESAGLETGLAWRIMEFLPLPCGRAVFDGYVQFQPDYIRYDAQGRERFHGLLMDEPVYREALAIVPALASRGEDALQSIFGRSAEVNAINKALNNGSQLANLLTSSPVFTWEEGMPETAPQTALAPPAPPKSRWPFGSKPKT